MYLQRDDDRAGHFARNYKFGHHLASRVQASDSVDEALEWAALFFENGTE